MKKIIDIFALVILALVVSSCSREETTTFPGEAKKLPDQEIWDFKATTTTNGKVEAIIRAGHMQRYSKESRMLFDDGIHVDFYDEKGEHASVLTAASGEYEIETENVKAIGNVVVVSDSGITLYTDELYYYRENDRIISNTLVKVETKEGHVLHGVGFESDAQMNFWEIRQPYDGVAPGVDLSLDRFEKKERDSTLADSTELEIELEDPDTVIDTLVIEQ
ncbi:LPS export ABC transporter periplasmic protein LptC [candidate division KSB1 bacterium]|nr:LPS export ABC transporter periplasmic protein LptC [candidate division KSB1 bacterium]RQW05082.1 MAG: LPS export ABC transporter periplasmic protein LptC [candidate division KSB1 bacterium]